MDDLISRQAAIDALDKRFDNIPIEQTTEILQLRRDLRQLPSAQPEIIYCKDCKHYKYGMCMKICANKSTNGFCDWGERRTE